MRDCQKKGGIKMSIYAIHKQEPKFIFIINYKVMFSSLYFLLPQHFPSLKFCNKNQLNEINFRDFSKFAIVRNPFDRAVSAFYGKCRKNPEKNLQEETAQLEYCQAQLLRALAKIRNETFDIVEPAKYLSTKEHSKERELLDKNFKKLCSIDFNEYAECLSVIFRNEKVDGHFELQYKAFQLPQKKLGIFSSNLFKKTKIIKLENIVKEWANVCKDLGTSMNLVQENRTDNLRGDTEVFFTKETQDSIAKLYAIDFKKFRYSTTY